MIGTLLCAAALLQPQPPAPKTAELVDANADTVVVQAFVPAPEMGARDAAAWRVLGRVLLLGTREFSRDQVMRYGSQAGLAPVVVTMPDFMRVEFVAPKGGLSVAGELLEAVVKRPILPELDIRESTARLLGTHRQAWSEALWPVVPAWESVRVEDVRSLYARAFRPERVTFAVGGAIKPGEGIAEMAKRFVKWSVQRPPRARYDLPVKPMPAREEPVSTFELRGEAVNPATPNGSATMLATFALGVGKEGAMFRVLREQMGLSYRQEALLWPSATGWVPRLMVARRARPDEAGTVGAMREALLADVAKWDENARVRALAMAEASVLRQMPLNPFWLDAGGPMGDNLSDRTAWRGYLTMVGSGAVDERLLLDSMRNVTLEQMQAAAKSLLEGASATVVAGKRE